MRNELRQWIIPAVIIFGAYACTDYEPTRPPDDPLTAPTPATVTVTADLPLDRPMKIGEFPHD